MQLMPGKSSRRAGTRYDLAPVPADGGIRKQSGQRYVLRGRTICAWLAQGSDHEIELT